jgi:hypothetical protein
MTTTARKRKSAKATQAGTATVGIGDLGEVAAMIRDEVRNGATLAQVAAALREGTLILPVRGGYTTAKFKHVTEAGLAAFLHAVERREFTGGA